MTLQQSPEIQRIKSLQGGSSSTAPSFIRSEYNQNSSLSSATDLGTVRNLTRVFTGDIGSETGRNTLFYKVETTDPSDVRIFKNFVNTRTDKDIAVGLLDTNRHQIILDSQGFGQSTKYTTHKSLNLFESFLRAFTTSQLPAASGNLPPSASPCRSSGPVNSSGAQVALHHRLCAWPSSSSLAQLVAMDHQKQQSLPKTRSNCSVVVRVERQLQPSR